MHQVKNSLGKNYQGFSKESSEFHYKFFSYFKLVCCYGSFQYHFLVVRKDYCL